MIKLSNCGKASVDTGLKWLDATKVAPPTGVKILVINQRQGVAIMSNWNPHCNWTHWHPLPTFDKSKDK